MILNKILLLILIILNIFGNYTPEEGSPELKKKRKHKANYKKNLPNILIIGDSISIGYTPIVKKILKEKANVFHAPGNNQGTTLGVKKIDKWLTFKPNIKKWHIIHFNWGLHDLKHVKKTGSAENSNDFNDPQQADLATYKKNLTLLVKKLKATNAKLIFATTTPFPKGVKPARKPKDAIAYNEVALEIMRKNKIEINDLYKCIKPKLNKLQIKKNVHFNKKGSIFLGKKVAKEIIKNLEQIK